VSGGTDRAHVRLAELVAALSLGVDLGFGQPTRGEGRAVAEPADQRLIEAQRVDQPEGIADQLCVGDRSPARIDGPAASPQVGCDDPELLRKGIHVAGVGHGAARPQRVGRDHALVQEQERLAPAGLDVVDVDPVGVDVLIGCFEGHGARLHEDSVR
jgi:hypothetical protein